MKKYISYLFGSDLFHYFLKPFKLLVNYSNARRKERYLLEIQTFDFFKFNDLKVKNGPFTGLEYPNLFSYGSCLYPKILGCYERELWQVWDKLSNINYKRIIDIGCAEGYYAVGLARMFPNAFVKAYDISSNARELCFKMAITNNLNHKIEIKSKCDYDELMKYDFSEKTLIVCDCEGYEMELFNKVESNKFKNVDLVIETHDFMNINISTNLKEKFSQTHTFISIKSIDDIEKALTYSFKEIQQLNLHQRKMILSESRPSIMEWTVFLSKSSEF